MQNDPDLYPSNNPQPVYTQPQGVFSTPLTDPAVYQNDAAASGGAKISIYFATLFTVLNIIFLGLAAGYSTGLFSQSSSTSDGASYFITVIMVLIAGSFALTSAVIGIHLSKAQNVLKFALINRILLILTIVLAILVLVGPVIIRMTE